MKTLLFLFLGLTLNAQITGKVIDQQSYFSDGNIYTNNLIETAIDTVTIKTYGGIIGLQAETVSDTPQLRIGQTGQFITDGQFLTRYLPTIANRDGEILVSPQTVNAGVGDIVTITGANFGDRSLVKFSNADFGGLAVVEIDSSLIIEWTDSKIRAIVPSFAGTGMVRVELTDGTRLDSDPIEVGYSLINFQNELPLLPDTNGQGGFTFSFADNVSDVARTYIEDAFDAWRCTSQTNYIIDDTVAPNQTTNDGINVIRFTDTGTLSTSVLAQVITRFQGCNDGSGGVLWYVKEKDMRFNVDLFWNYDNDGGAGFDFNSVAVHEIGHIFNLGHVADPNKVMYYAFGAGTVRDEITAIEHEGATYMANESFSNSVCGLASMTPYACGTLSNPDHSKYLAMLYPNPTESILNAVGDIYNMSGKHVMKKPEDPNVIKMNVSLLQAGLYFIRLNDTTVKRFVKK